MNNIDEDDNVDIFFGKTSKPYSEDLLKEVVEYLSHLEKLIENQNEEIKIILKRKY